MVSIHLNFLVGGVVEQRAVGPHREALPQARGDLLRAERDEGHVVARDARLAVLREAERGLDGVLVEGVELRLQAVGQHLRAARRDLDLVGVVGIRRALEGDEDLHGDDSFAAMRDAAGWSRVP